MTTRQQVAFKAALRPVDTATGEFEAIVATLGVKDHDGDVILPGAFKDGAEIRIIWHHDWTRPVGKAVLRQKTIDGLDRMVAEGRFFLKTDSGREAWALVDEMGGLQEWSWGFFVHEGAAEKGVLNGEEVTFLGPLKDGSPGLEVFEASPVLLGAGIGTATLAIKNRDGGVTAGLESMDVNLSAEAVDDGNLILIKAGDRVLSAVPTSQIIKGDPHPSGKRLADEVADAARGLRSATERLADVVALRAAKDRPLGEDTRDAVDALTEAVAAAQQVLDGVNTEPEPAADDDTPDPDLARLWAELNREQVAQTQRTLGWLADD